MQSDYTQISCLFLLTYLIFLFSPFVLEVLGLKAFDVTAFMFAYKC